MSNKLKIYHINGVYQYQIDSILQVISICSAVLMVWQRQNEFVMILSLFNHFAIGFLFKISFLSRSFSFAPHWLAFAWLFCLICWHFHPSSHDEWYKTIKPLSCHCFEFWWNNFWFEFQIVFLLLLLLLFVPFMLFASIRTCVRIIDYMREWK